VGHAEPFGQFPDAADSEEDKPNMFGPCRGLINESSPE
jgi:hypothetical protein